MIELSLWLAERSFAGRLIVTGAMDVAKAHAVLGQVEGVGPVTVMVKPVRLEQLREALSREPSD